MNHEFIIMGDSREVMVPVPPEMAGQIPGAVRIGLSQFEAPIEDQQEIIRVRLHMPDTYSVKEGDEMLATIPVRPDSDSIERKERVECRVVAVIDSIEFSGVPSLPPMYVRQVTLSVMRGPRR